MSVDVKGRSFRMTAARSSSVGQQSSTAFWRIFFDSDRLEFGERVATEGASAEPATSFLDLDGRAGLAARLAVMATGPQKRLVVKFRPDCFTVVSDIKL